ncbi:MAG: DevR family CRISPR-associated autoregulator [Candidatus Poribacteria bacterium]|nr:DevR family CRISPR-associated autoregulator [Candidatus Poribacteria bacterium]
MNDNKAIYSLTICGQATIDMHSLNNEGSEGNQIATRMVNVYDQMGKLAAVNAISGDMFKHIQAEHLFHFSRNSGLNLCSGCQKFSANRILDDETFLNTFDKNTPDNEIITTMLQTCTIDDVEGILVTAKNKSTPRKSIVEFGWVVGIPELNTTDNYFHVKYVSDSGVQNADSSGSTGDSGTQNPSDNASDDDSGANLGQNIFHRPANSGIYAIVAGIEVSRLGFNDISQAYAIGEEERNQRYKALIESLLCTFVEPNGAMRSAQNPHLVNFEGVVSLSTKILPAPTVSPLNKCYKEEIQRIANALNQIEAGAIECQKFDTLGNYAELMASLANTTEPYKISYNGGN